MKYLLQLVMPVLSRKLSACQTCAFGTRALIITCPSIFSQLCYHNYFLLTYLTCSPVILFYSPEGVISSIVDIIRNGERREVVLSFCKQTFISSYDCVYLRYVNSVTLIYQLFFFRINCQWLYIIFIVFIRFTTI